MKKEQAAGEDMTLSSLRGIGPARLDMLRAMGVTSLRDFLYVFPVKYEDRTRLTPIKECVSGEDVLIQGIVREKPKYSRFGAMVRVTARIEDASGFMPLTWFNQPWMAQQLPVGVPILLYGRYTVKDGRRSLFNGQVVEKPEILPAYRLPKGIQQKRFQGWMAQALQEMGEGLPDTLPYALRQRHQLCDLGYALSQAHFPSDAETLRIARRRIAFEKFLFFQLAMALVRNHQDRGLPMGIPAEQADVFWSRMPFSPTAAQKRVLEEIRADLNRDRAMSRLVQGDVGCGKTAVAFGAIWLVCQQGYQCAMMAPTEILAQQHYETARVQLAAMGISCGLLTGSMKMSEKKQARAYLSDGGWQCVFGTHALLSEGVEYQRLGLVITDEQHRFGVNQRSALQRKGASGNAFPHVLVMSATPIPRTLALILYGDLDVSIVDELPPGRTPVKTRLVGENRRKDMYGFLRGQVQGGHQAYVVCPLVEESEMLEDVRSAKSTFAELTASYLNGLRVGLTWGSQSPAEKEQVLRDFAAHQLDVLVSTTVIEVGVNVPNATVMVVENAERYGLSQLHQLRGRVGRGAAESWCFLLADGNKRLRVLTETTDGFEISRQDLAIRGPGELMGTRQSGVAMEGMVLDGDVKLLEETSACLKSLLQNPDYREELQMVEQEAARIYQDAMGSFARN